MANTPLRAHFDGEQIRLDTPFPIPVNAALVVYVLSPTEADDLAGLCSLGQENFARCYSDDEPVYTLDDVKP